MRGEFFREFLGLGSHSSASPSQRGRSCPTNSPSRAPLRPSPPVRTHRPPPAATRTARAMQEPASSSRGNGSREASRPSNHNRTQYSTSCPSTCNAAWSSSSPEFGWLQLKHLQRWLATQRFCVMFGTTGYRQGACILEMRTGSR